MWLHYLDLGFDILRFCLGIFMMIWFVKSYCKENIKDMIYAGIWFAVLMSR